MENLVLAIGWHEQDSWYGKNYRLVFKGEDGNGFKTKTEAKKYLSILKKFLKHSKGVKDVVVEIGKEDSLETYKYVSLGPSWSCTNIDVNVDNFKDFKKMEEARLAAQREEREKFPKLSRESRSEQLRKAKEERKAMEAYISSK